MNMRFLFLLLLALMTSLLEAKLPLQVKKSVAFIFVRDTSNRLQAQGTGFFVLLRTNQNADTANFGYLVTTKSTLYRRDGSSIDSLYIRINRKDGFADTLIIPLIQNGVRRYFVHPDSLADLAIIPAYPDLNRYDALFTPVNMIAGVDFLKNEGIVEGDEVFYTGMLSSHFGIFKNIPVVRTGKIVQISDEKYLWGRGYTEFYLVETAMSDGGNGSPLYFYSAAVKDSGKVTMPAKLLLTGVVSGRFGESRESNLIRVVPAFKLIELLNTPDVFAEREKEFIRMKEVKGK
ncbi:MAG: hypothetical protein WCW40_04870 [Bacteroidota bacterium]